MDDRTGNIVSDINLIPEAQKIFYKPIDRNILTGKQRQEMRVNLHDRVTPAAKQLHLSRGSMRNKPCPCGSGVKFKKCCMR